MKTYKIPIIYQSVGQIEVEANTLQEAVNKALDIFLSVANDTYIEDSFEIDPSITYNYPGEEYHY